MADSNNTSGLPPPPPPMGQDQEDGNSMPPPPNQQQQQGQQQGPPPRMPAQSPTPEPQQRQPQQQSQPQPQPQQPPSPSASPSPSPAPSPSNNQSPSHSSPSHHGGQDDISTEEYVEAVIEERWADIEDDIRKIVEWKNDSEQRITQLSQQFEDLKDRFDKLHQALIGKIESYDKNIMEVGAELKAMEKVFSKVMPSFTENVKQLDDITKKLDKK